MEADWEVEIGGDAPVIEAHWNGFVDLRTHPERVLELSECRELPALADALITLNGADSPVWTSKTDVFIPEHIDPDEIAASTDEAAHAIACYIDLLPRSQWTWTDLEIVERDYKQVCARLRGIELSRCRVDVVVRRFVGADADGLGTTAYCTGCGSTRADARSRLGECLMAFTNAMVSPESLGQR
jgi:hypothetical protein